MQQNWHKIPQKRQTDDGSASLSFFLKHQDEK
jgi:hypothetical protein